MTVILQRPYHFIPPHRGNGWPTAIQKLRLVDWHLRKTECVVDYELRHAERFADSLAAGHGIVLAPNHCRYADPLVLGWLAREVGTHLYAMASWHLFNSKAFETFALRRMGAFSIYREGNDRKALEMAIHLVATAERPLVLFPEGTTNRTNDLLKPLLDGIGFIARSAAKRRQKAGQGRVVMHPMALKYLCVGDAWKWADEQLRQLEIALSWHPSSVCVEPSSLRQRLMRISEAYLALKEIEHVGKASTGDLRLRRDALIEFLIHRGEQRYQLSPADPNDIRERGRKIRSAIASEYFAPLADRDEPHARTGRSGAAFNAEEEIHSGTATNCQASDIAARDPAPYANDAESIDLALFLLSFPDQYLNPGEVTDTRVVETIQRIQEAIFGKAKETMPMKVVIEVDEAIEIPAERAPRGQKDPLLCQLQSRLRTMISSLSSEARDFDKNPHSVLNGNL